MAAATPPVMDDYTFLAISGALAAMFMGVLVTLRFAQTRSAYLTAELAKVQANGKRALLVVATAISRSCAQSIRKLKVCNIKSLNLNVPNGSTSRSLGWALSDVASLPYRPSRSSCRSSAHCNRHRGRKAI